MRKINFLKSVVVAAFFMVAGSGAFAQVTAPGYTLASLVDSIAPALNVDTVAVNSVMPYSVKGDLNMHSLRALGALTYSNFNWALSGGGTLGSLSNNATPQAPKDTSVSVKWGATAGSYDLRVLESPVAAAGQPAFSCTGNTTKLGIVVVANPIAVWSGATPLGGCGVANSTINVPFKLTGTGNFDVTYTIDYKNLSGVVTAGTATTASYGDKNVVTAKSFNIPVVIPATTYGQYTVTISKVVDRITKKCFDVSAFTSTVGTDVPSAGFVVYSYPAPTTQPIQHVKNL